MTEGPLLIHQMGDTFLFWDELAATTHMSGAFFRSRDLPIRIQPAPGTVVNLESMTGTARYAVVDYDSVHDTYELSLLSWTDKGAG